MPSVTFSGKGETIMGLPIILAAGLALTGWSGMASADPGKDESGQGAKKDTPAMTMMAGDVAVTVRR